MDLRVEQGFRLFDRLRNALDTAAPGTMTISLGDSRQWKIYPPVILTADYLEFRPDRAEHKPIIVALSQVVSFQ